MEDVFENAIYEFEEFRLDTRRRELTAPAERRHVPLKAKEYDTLLFFVSHAGQLIDKAALMKGIWPGLVVEENNLNQQITALRHLLGEESGSRRFIMNVRGRGYQFVPDVLRLDEVARSGAPSRATNAASAPPTRNSAAWQCYQQAILLTGLDDPSQWSAAVDVLSRAVTLDPSFASALAYLAQSQLRLMASDWPISFETVNRADQAAQQALALRPDLAIVQMAAGAVAAARGHWVEAEKRFRSAAASDEDWLLVGDVHSAHVLLSAGHLRRALELSRASQQRGNGMIGIVLIHGLTYLTTDNDAEARDAMNLIAAMGGQANRPHIASILARLAQRARRFDEAVSLLQASLSDTLRAAGSEAVIAAVVAATAERSLASSAIDAIDSLVVRLGFQSVPQSLRHQILSWYTELGALDKAYPFADDMLDHLGRQGIVGMTWSGLWLREMREFRRDRRFEPLAARMGLTQYWNHFGPPDELR